MKFQILHETTNQLFFHIEYTNLNTKLKLLDLTYIKANGGAKRSFHGATFNKMRQKSKFNKSKNLMLIHKIFIH